MGLDWLTSEGLTVDEAVVGVRIVELLVLSAGAVWRNLNLDLVAEAVQVKLLGSSSPGEV